MALFGRAKTQDNPVDVATLNGPLVALRNIEKSFAHGPSRTWVLRRISLAIQPGEFVSIMGPSGAGKSTLLHIIGMHDSEWTGEYDFACTPEMTERTAEKVKNSECITFSGGHFPTSEDPLKFKEVVSPVLKKVLALDPERRGQAGGLSGRTSLSSTRSERPQAGGRRVIEL